MYVSYSIKHPEKSSFDSKKKFFESIKFVHCYTENIFLQELLYIIEILGYQANRDKSFHIHGEK